MNLRAFVLMVFALASAYSALPAWAVPGEPVGSVKTVQGEAFVDRGGESLSARPGFLVLAADTLRTGSDGSLGILFRDDSILSLGPDSVFELEEFRFEPAALRFGFLGRIVKGTASYLSGLMGKLSPESVRFETPEATIGIRGTKFAIQVR
jgi:hypothetical protein